MICTWQAPGGKFPILPLSPWQNRGDFNEGFLLNVFLKLIGYFNGFPVSCRYIGEVSMLVRVVILFFPSTEKARDGCHVKVSDEIV